MKKSFSTRLFFLLAVTAVCLISLFFMPRVAQDPAFHRFADRRTVLGVPNGLNVLSNLVFLLTGSYGLFLVHRSGVKGSAAWCYYALFTAIFFTAIGSAYYHLHPDNGTLAYDRLPMVFVFMSFLAATITEWISPGLGGRLLLPLLLLGIAGVAWWAVTERAGRGDLRLYGFVQFYPMVAVPLILVLFPAAGRARSLQLLLWVIGWYLIAKAFEHYDRQLLSLTGVSGHTLKHLAAGVATWYIARFFRVRHVSARPLKALL